MKLAAREGRVQEWLGVLWVQKIQSWRKLRGPQCVHVSEESSPFSLS